MWGGGGWKWGAEPASSWVLNKQGLCTSVVEEAGSPGMTPEEAEIVNHDNQPWAEVCERKWQSGKSFSQRDLSGVVSMRTASHRSDIRVGKELEVN